MKRLMLPALLAFLLLVACDKGLAPRDPGDAVTSLEGVVFFTNWPAPDSLKDLRLVAFRQFPPQNIIAEVLQMEAFAYPSIGDSGLTFYQDRLEFQFEVPSGVYGYLVVAQQYGDNILNDWRAVGQYDIDSDSLPSPIEVFEGQVTKDVFIYVDFDNPPIQPF